MITPRIILKHNIHIFLLCKVGATCGVALASYKQEYYGRQASVVEMDGKLEDINDYKNIETYLSATAAKVPGELAAELIKVTPSLSFLFLLSLPHSLSFLNSFFS